MGTSAILQQYLSPPPSILSKLQLYWLILVPEEFVEGYAPLLIFSLPFYLAYVCISFRPQLKHPFLKEAFSDPQIRLGPLFYVPQPNVHSLS